MVWKEVTTALNENRREIVLTGKEISNRIKENGLDLSIFDLVNLNYLCISESTLCEVPGDVQKLINLQTLVMHSNAIVQVTPNICKLTKLKVIDLSHNLLKSIDIDFSSLKQLATLNLYDNQLESFPTLTNNSKLTVLNLSNNKLKSFPDVCHKELCNLSELYLSNNEIDLISENVKLLSSLKIFHINANKLKVIPGELYDCSKLKELNLKENQLSDKRLVKLIDKNTSKQVLDYIKQNCKRSANTDTKVSQKNMEVESQNNCESADDNEQNSNYKIIVKSYTNKSLKITVTEEAKQVRPYIVACIVLNVDFNQESFKKFIQIQTKLHETICNKRTAATIATHDWDKLNNGHLTYTASAPDQFVIKPLNGTENITGGDLFAKLQKEAQQIRKEKKRNTYSGIHKYLSLVEEYTKYPILINSSKEVISFPPITNSDITKISLATKSILIEITSATSLQICKKAADCLIKEMLMLLGNTVTIQQVQNVDINGEFKFVYPARPDLVFEKSEGIFVEREPKI